MKKEIQKLLKNINDGGDLGFLNLNVSKAKYINTKNNHLTFTLENGEIRQYFVSDINILLIDNLQTTITLNTLNGLSKNKVTVLLCDENHLPQTIIMPFNAHFQMSKVYNWQISLKAPVRKQLWQSIIRSKIANQAICLKMLELEATPLFDMEKKVTSGDGQNLEAVAASYYFKQLFKNKFTRKDANLFNSALNYGYSIIRSLIARNVAIYGLLPFLGIKHKNELNNFNLVDDLIEPFRPFVDYYIFSKFANSDDDKLTAQHKKIVFDMLNFNILADGKKQIISNAVEIVVESFVMSLKTNSNKIILPKLISLQEHAYE